MPRMLAIVALALIAAPASAAKPCEELKSEIAAKLDAKGVKGYQLSIVSTAAASAQNVVGHCEGGQKKITYERVR